MNVSLEDRIDYARALAEQGARREAERLLLEVVDEVPHHAVAWALLGEQRLRQGRWDQGAQDYLTALARDQRGAAAHEFERVVSDMLEAASQGRVPVETAEGFINRVDYQAPSLRPELKQFLASARRVLRVDESLAPIMRTRPSRPGQPERDAPRQKPSTSPPPPEDSSLTRSSPRPKPNALQAAIQRDRQANAALLEGLAAMNAPRWPSSADYAPIDDVPRVADVHDEAWRKSLGIDAPHFSVTTGDILSEIFLERCLRVLMVATQKQKATTIPLRPERITQLEMNLRDGLLEDLPALSPLYEDQPGYDEYQSLALGMFLGECFVRTYGATWRFDATPAASRVVMGEAELNPFDWADRWLDASDKDAVWLEDIARRAAQASLESTGMALPQIYIDPTRELRDQAMQTKLGELWSNYLFSVTDAAFPVVASSVVVRDVTDAAITFEIGASWAPRFVPEIGPAARNHHDRVFAAYLRSTGEFLMLASRKAVARLIEAKYPSLERGNALEAFKLITTYHRPGWRFVLSQADATKIRARTGSQAPPTPELREKRNGRDVVAWAWGDGDWRRVRLDYKPDSIIPWRVEHASGQPTTSS